MSQESSSNKAFVYSLLIHLAVLGTMLLGIFLKLFESEPPKHVFELVTASAPAAVQAPTQPERTPPDPVIPQPVIERNDPLPPLPKIDTSPIPQPPPPQEIPTPPPPAPAKATPTPPPPPPPPKQISYEEWARNRKLPERTQTVTPKAQNRPVNVPKIDTSAILQNLQSSVVNVSATELRNMTANQQSELNDYYASIRSRLHAVFRPTSPNLSAVAEFKVQSNGRITNVRIIQSSGDAAYDASVLQAFRDMQQPGPPPGGKPYDFRITVRSHSSG